MKEIEADVLIIGSGLVGLLAAHCLSLLSLDVIIIDKKDFKKYKKPSLKDTRTVAISEGSKQFLEKLFLWKGIKKNAEPIKNIKVFDRDSSNKIIFQNINKQNKLGYVIENSIFSDYLIKILKKKKNVKILYESELLKINSKKTYSEAYLKKYIIRTKLIIAADGKKSAVRQIVGNKVYEKKYKESALVINFFHEIDLKNTAYEIFYNTGPLAILPMISTGDRFRSSLIWSNKNLFVKKILDCNDEFIKNILYEKIGSIVGKVIKINSKQKFPLSAHINDAFYNNRMIFIGDSAHSVHPIAGQGWNLGVKDVKNLNFLLNEFSIQKKDIGSVSFCKKYNSLSYKNAFQLYQITDKLNFHFKRKEYFYRILSNTGLNFIENNKSLKNKITNYAMGF